MELLAKILAALTTTGSSMTILAAKAREAANAQGVPMEVRDHLLRLADQLEALRDSTDFQVVLDTAMREAGRAAATGKAVISHTPTDVF